jgi:hypothetical protein
MKFIVIPCLLLFLPLSLFAQGWPSEDSDINPVDEARLAALWLSDSLFVPEDLAQEIQNKLALLRKKYSEEIPQVNIKFQFPAPAKTLIVMMKPHALEELKESNYHEWDSLNQANVVDSIVIDSTHYGREPMVRIRFKDYLNPFLTIPEYSNLNGIKYASALPFPGDWSNVYPWFVDGQMAFLVRKAWGDCPAGCLHSRYYYFKCNDDQINFIGEFGTPEGEYKTPDEYRRAFKYPSWWEEIKPAICRYHRLSQDECKAIDG